jgi:hypothetical protein
MVATKESFNIHYYSMLINICVQKGNNVTWWPIPTSQTSFFAYTRVCGDRFRTRKPVFFGRSHSSRWKDRSFAFSGTSTSKPPPFSCASRALDWFAVKKKLLSHGVPSFAGFDPTSRAHQELTSTCEEDPGILPRTLDSLYSLCRGRAGGTVRLPDRVETLWNHLLEDRNNHYLLSFI